MLASALRVAPKAADFLEAEESQKVQGLLVSLKELLGEGAKRAAEKEQEAAEAAAKAKEDGADNAAAGASARVKRPRREAGYGQPEDMDDFDADQAVAAGMGPELLAKLPPGAKEVMAHLIEQYRSSPDSG